MMETLRLACSEPYSYSPPSRPQQAGSSGSSQAWRRTWLRLEAGPAICDNARSGTDVFASWFSVRSRRFILQVKTLRLVTNSEPDRANDSGRVSHEALRFDHLTNHSDGDCDVSTIRLSRGQSTRLDFFLDRKECE
jgi:hypothetical protein